ncbi:PQQ-binding-like beta-propeller repeat protein [Micromonospora profundi]|uniref:outer membrane protein assembly factor BamB family protein n=1 Tax=Micromonospora TaxID=1873 RepID=UPI0033B457E9
MDHALQVLWSRLLHLRSNESTLAGSPGALVVAERHSRLVRLDPETGASLWDQAVEDCWGTTAVAGECCLYLSQAGVLHCFDMHTGQRRWSTPDLSLRHHVSVAGSVVLLGGWRGYRGLTRLDLTNGQPLPGRIPGLTPGSSLAWPLPVRWDLPSGSTADTFLVAAADQAALLLVDAQTGVTTGTAQVGEP